MTALRAAPIVLALLVLLPALLLSRRKPDAALAALRSLATPRDVALLTPRGVEVAARRLRKGLSGRPLQKDLGVVLGRLEPRGPILRASWEDVVVAVMAPRAGRTTSLVVPAVSTAGPELAFLWRAVTVLPGLGADGSKAQEAVPFAVNGTNTTST